MSAVALALRVGDFSQLEFPDGCTVGQWKQLVGQGFLGDTILYSTKLICRAGELGRTLEDSALLPQPPDKMYVEGTSSVVKMLELALRKRLGPPGRGLPQLRRPSDTLVPNGRVAPEPAPRSPPRSPRQPPEPRPAPQRSWRSLRGSGEDSRLRFFCSGLQGLRPHMEDRSLGVLELPGAPHAGLFGIFDGHGGHEVAAHATRVLPGLLAGRLNEGLSPADALRTSFLQLDRELRGVTSIKRNSHPFDRVGSTAVTVLVMREEDGLRLFCANIGDSRAVLCRGTDAVDLSRDQKPQDPEERRRIEAAGGRVEMLGPCWRIDSGLNLSRALGDFSYKSNTSLAPEQQKVIAVPEVKEILLTKKDRFAVMGSDGVFDVLSSAALVEHLLSAQRRGEPWPEALETALSRSLPGGDNVSLCLVEFLDHSN